MMEAARTLTALIAAKKIPAPRVTIHFMWVPEFFGTLAYVSSHANLKRCPAWDQANPDQAPCIIANINADMVGEDTVKTASRFYFTRTPDSAPSILDGLLNDLLHQTREANLYAGTGTRNYWPTEAIPYAQGSDHDVFLGLGIPATMLGHDPDWTHHTSEDKIDKTDASEFLRVGTLASAAGYWLAHAGPDEWRQIDAAQSALDAGLRAQRVATDLAGEVTPAATRRVQRNTAALQRAAARIDALKPGAAHTLQAQLTVLPDGPRRLAILPLDASAFEGISATDGQWLAQQQERFASDSEGLPVKPNFALISFEAVCFMNGHRTTGQIAELLSDEFLVDIDQAWVDRLAGILEKQKIVSEKPYH
jgi:hypothetical protein